jgi:hypothetical protein
MKRMALNQWCGIVLGGVVALAFVGCVEDGPEAPPLTGPVGPTLPADAGLAGSGGAAGGDAGGAAGTGGASGSGGAAGNGAGDSGIVDGGAADADAS